MPKRPDDNLLRGFDFQTRFIHDISVSHASGNVITEGRGEDFCFDHHKRAPYANLFTDIDAGKGSRLWFCGGGDALGKNCGARGTFWNIHSAQPQSYPPDAFGPPSMNLVAIETNEPGETHGGGRWFEAITPQAITPRNLYAAQKARRKNHSPS